MSAAPDPIKAIRTIYDRQAENHGATPEAVFWKNREGQVLRYEILLGIVEAGDLSGGVSVGDLGCGYGAFFDLIKDTPLMRKSRYVGADVSKGMIALAGKNVRDERAAFAVGDRLPEAVDYSFASGTFNMKGPEKPARWENRIAENLIRLWQSTRKGMAFNMLDKDHSEKMEGLYYADADAFVGFCRAMLSDRVEVVRGYPLEEWTIFVRR